jgi:two-component system sensor histidine kinase and response regulator WspE
VGDPFGTNADPALVELFRAESDTHIPVLSQGLLAMEKGQADDQSVASMMRAAHSIKGAARIVGIDAAVRVAHVMEDCFTAAKDKRSILSSDAVDVLLAGVDALQRICALQPEADMTEAWLEAVVGRLTAVKEGKVVAAAAAPVEAAPIVAPPARVEGGSSRRFALPAEFDDSAAETLRGRLLAAFEDSAGPIEIDFGQVKSVSARGLALLVSASREAARHDAGAVMTARGASGAVAAMLRVTALDRTLGPGA